MSVPVALQCDAHLGRPLAVLPRCCCRRLRHPQALDSLVLRRSQGLTTTAARMAMGESSDQWQVTIQGPVYAQSS